MLRPYIIMKKRIVCRPTILIHGGCGRRPPTKKQLRILRQVLKEGYALLQNGTSAVDTVEAAVVLLERSGRFNAGGGSKRQMDGVMRMDASIMDGHDLSAGAVAAMEGILTPISAARCVMEQTPHVMLAGEAARKLARSFGVEPLLPSLRRKQPTKLSEIPTRWRQLSKRLSKLGTVGAVARDRHDHLAAGTSTGGFSLMLPGRVGDSPLIGAGTYADDRSGAVSMTGDGTDSPYRAETVCHAQQAARLYYLR